MSAQLAFKDKIIDLNQEITYNLQIADIADVNKSKSNYTSTFTIPRTVENVKIFEGLGIPGDLSTVPYAVSNVVCMSNYVEIYRGTLIVLKTDEVNYHATVISGAYDFFTLLGDTVFSDLDISEIVHAKTPTNVADLITNTNGPLAYFAGFFTTDSTPQGEQYYENGLNIDAMAPAVKLEYLLDKTFEFAGIDYELPPGLDISNEFLTFPYPPFLQAGSDGYILFDARRRATTPTPIDIPPERNLNDPNIRSQYAEFDSALGLGYYAIGFDIHIERTQQVIVAIKEAEFFVSFQNQYEPVEGRIYLNGTLAGTYMTDTLNQSSGELYRTVMDLEIGDTVRLEFHKTNPSSPLTPIPMTAYLNSLVVHFIDASQLDPDARDEIFGMQLKKFMKEFMARYALIPVQTENAISFITYQQIMGEEYVDMSDKFMRRTEETYDIGYGFNNWLRHSYAQDGEDYYDLNLISNNENAVKDNTIFKSEFFAPSEKEYDLITYRSSSAEYTVKSNIWPTYDVTFETKDGITVPKVSTQNRQFWVKIVNDVDQSVKQVRLTSATLPGGWVIQTIYLNVGEFSAAFSSQSQWYPLEAIIVNTRRHVIELNLTEMDAHGIDLTKPVYLQQEGSKYMLNKLQFTNGTPAKGEFIKIN